MYISILYNTIPPQYTHFYTDNTTLTTPLDWPRPWPHITSSMLQAVRPYELTPIFSFWLSSSENSRASARGRAWRRGSNTCSSWPLVSTSSAPGTRPRTNSITASSFTTGEDDRDIRRMGEDGCGTMSWSGGRGSMEWSGRCDCDVLDWSTEGGVAPVSSMRSESTCSTSATTVKVCDLVDNTSSWALATKVRRWPRPYLCFRYSKEPQHSRDPWEMMAIRSPTHAHTNTF